MSEQTKVQCPECRDMFVPRKDGTLRWHLGTEYDGRWRQLCHGVGKPPVVSGQGEP